MQEENENNLLARWLNNELTAEEKAELEKNGDEKVLRSIVDTVDQWSLPELKEETFRKVRERTGAPSSAKVVPLYRKPWVLAMAASLLLVVGLFWIFSTGKTTSQLAELTSKAGETKTFTLSDSTTVTLYGKSKLSYDAVAFAGERRVSLEGSGYFEVTRKGNFEVNYNGGVVRVLGTKFNILSGTDISTVKCFEGKVQVEMQEEKVELGAGDGVRKTPQGKAGKFHFEPTEAAATQGETRFENAPLREVCSSLSLYYDVKIIAGNIDLDRSFTGRFTQSNLDTALTMVFAPMSISYRHEGGTVYLENK